MRFRKDLAYRECDFHNGSCRCPVCGGLWVTQDSPRHQTIKGFCYYVFVSRCGECGSVWKCTKREGYMARRFDMILFRKVPAGAPPIDA
jgi:hypothetical protein